VSDRRGLFAGDQGDGSFVLPEEFNLGIGESSRGLLGSIVERPISMELVPD